MNNNTKIYHINNGKKIPSKHIPTRESLLYMLQLQIQNLAVPYLVLLPCAVEDVMSGGLDSLNDPCKA